MLAAVTISWSQQLYLNRRRSRTHLAISSVGRERHTVVVVVSQRASGLCVNGLCVGTAARISRPFRLNRRDGDACMH